MQWSDRGVVTQRDVRTAWAAMADGRPPGRVRALVQASWRRCQELELDPRRIDLFTVEPQALAARRAELSVLRGVALPVMRRLHAQIRGSRSVVVLTDAHGVILDSFGDPVFEPRIPIAVPGASWSEAHLGTNGVGTCLANGEATQIVGAEHYFEPIQVYTCSAAPVRATDGALLGCLDVSSPRTRTHEHTLGMVAVAAEAIEKQLSLQENLDVERGILEILESGILTLDARGALRGINRKACEQLGLQSEAVLGLPIDEILEGADLLGLVEHQDRVLDRPVNLRAGASRFEGDLSAACLRDPGGQRTGMVVRLEDRARVQRVVARESGLRASFTFADIVGDSLPMAQCLELARVAAASTSNVLLRGESGTGKELFAQAIHNGGPRAARPFVAVNCGALPRELVQSELFGYREGAFTGARKGGHTGKFELADGGTIFLDEIGDMPLDAQVNLLRFLETRELTRVGDVTPRKVDVRVIAATHTDLEQAIAEQRFREDLYYRLDVLSLEIPPLRARGDDIEHLAEHFCDKYARQLGRPPLRLSRTALRQLRAARWPGNIRQLENTLERAVNVVRGTRIDASDLPPEVLDPPGRAAPLPASGPRPKATASGSLKAEQGRQVEETLRRCRGNVRRAAAELGVARSTVYDFVRRYEIDLKRYRG